MYSRHLNSESPVLGPGPKPDSNLSNANKNQNAKVMDPPFLTRVPSDPPLLQRDPPHLDIREPLPLKRGVTSAADNYVHNLNLHHDYQGRRGHMRVNYAQPLR